MLLRQKNTVSILCSVQCIPPWLFTVVLLRKHLLQHNREVNIPAVWSLDQTGWHFSTESILCSESLPIMWWLMRESSWLWRAAAHGALIIAICKYIICIHIVVKCGQLCQLHLVEIKLLYGVLFCCSQNLHIFLWKADCLKFYGEN